jgi:RimJ/RimL family protein N-acetyltransferase
VVTEGNLDLEIPVLETDRLLLRGFRNEDLDTLTAFCADEEVMHFIGGTTDRTGAWRQMAFALGHWQLRGSGFWAVERKSDGALIGRIGCLEPEGWPGFEVGWMLGRQYWGHGYAYEAAAAAIDYSFDVLNKQRVISLIDPENEASIALALRLGESPGDETTVHDTRVIVYAVDRGTWHAHRRDNGATEDSA